MGVGEEHGGLRSLQGAWGRAKRNLGADGEVWLHVGVGPPQGAVMEARSWRHTGVLCHPSAATDHSCSMNTPCACGWVPPSSTHHGSLVLCLREVTALRSNPPPVGAKSSAKYPCLLSFAGAIPRRILHVPQGAQEGWSPRRPRQ